MAISQATAFIASDGTTFFTREEAEVHESNLQVAIDIDTYNVERLEEPMNQRNLNLLHGILPDFIATMGYIKAPEQVDFADIEPEGEVAFVDDEEEGVRLEVV